VTSDAFDLENGVGFLHTKGEGGFFGHQGNGANGPRCSHSYFDLEQRDHVLDHVKQIASPLRNEMQKVKDPATMGCLFGQSYLERAGPIMFDQRIWQQKMNRVQYQLLAPERGVVVVLAKNRA
jgi:hypothetical protein